MTTPHDSSTTRGTADSNVSCSSCPTGSTAPPGSPPTLKQRVLEAGAGVAQSFTPVKQIHAHLCALHAYASQPQRQVVAHHYCTHLTSSIHQCVLYDSADANARIVGIEYLISRQIFDSLPHDEKPYWHSHQYEVESGLLVMPGLPELLERPMMKEVAAMYGKIVCTWQSDRDALPLGPPVLMVSPTRDSVVDARVLEQKDAVTGVRTEDRRRDREGKLEILHDKPDAVDAWERGEFIDFVPRIRRQPGEAGRGGDGGEEGGQEEKAAGRQDSSTGDGGRRTVRHSCDV